MDNTRIYIEMCDKAEEIQKGWIISDWDFVYCRGSEMVEVLSGYEVDGGYYGHSSEPQCDCPVSNGAYRGGFRVFRDEHFWLPQQADLQKMIIDSYREHWGNAVYAGMMEEAVSFASQYPYPSMEQLWLAFVMWGLHQKRWSGTEWVKEE